MGDMDMVDNARQELMYAVQNLDSDYPDIFDEDKVMMINYILPYFEKIGEYEICKELHDQITPNS